MSVRKRLALAGAAVTAVGAVATLVAGFTFGLFSATESSSSNSFTAGTVTVTTTTPTSVVCTITNMIPGDASTNFLPAYSNSSDTPCTYNVEYTGSASAWLGVDVTVSDGGTALFSSGLATGVQFQLKDATPTTFLSSSATNSTNTGDTTYTAQGGTATALPAAGISDLLIGTTAATNGAVEDFTLDYGLPLDSGNVFQAGSVTVTLTFHAVQSKNNPLPGTCTAGEQCLAAGSFAWS
ncbi:MAG TPA: TasA family protein [Streptosporangiaceae bacterium]|nr:TasA family protein [Streptosporangiaceae bacterium]